ncbi:terminase [Microbacterium phage Efeko]|uniref:Terminase n=1 Tax=Microbacterium phage Efeko TaxID=2315704 RepID=A0A386KP91_9CAUD|nr:terminase [Microbacterium phage Efeko]AYD86251.1 terminase [Microbacterium phage Efeko]
MSTLSPPFPDIAAWPPRRWTPPLSEDFPSAFDGYRELFRFVWFAAFGYYLEPWQETMLRHALELYPPGHRRAGQLRWRQVVITLGRQNGKTELAAALGLFGLLMKAAPNVVGVASSAEQARLIYKRTMRAIRGTPQLARRFKALTETRGIQTKDGGQYEIKPAKSAALQGIPIDLGLVDELHLIARALWFDLVNGLGGRANCLVAGITTAGDDGSELLLHLYDQGAGAIEAGDEARFGFWCWEADAGEIPEDDTELGRELARANPSVASGRVDLENAIEEVRSMPPQDAIRYRLNRFVEQISQFITGAMWESNMVADPFPAGVRPVVTIDRTPDWSAANISVFGKTADGRIYCDLAASLVKPSIGQLVELCVEMSAHDPVEFALDGYTLKDLGRELELRGLTVHYANLSDTMNGSALFYAKVQQQLLAHPGHDLLARQIPLTKRKDTDGGFRISRAASSSHIDGVMAAVIGVQRTENQRENVLQMF